MELAAFLASLLVTTCVSFRALAPPDVIANMVTMSIHETLRACLSGAIRLNEHGAKARARARRRAFFLDLLVYMKARSSIQGAFKPNEHRANTRIRIREQKESTMEVWHDLMYYWAKDFPFDNLEDNAGCMTTCALSRLGWLNASDQFNETKFSQYLSSLEMKLAKRTKEKQIDTVRKCYSPKNGTQEPCDPGLEFLRCYHETMFALGWNPSVIPTSLHDNGTVPTPQ